MAAHQQPHPEDHAIIGSVINGKYRVTQLCGRGGMGSVYEAQNIAIGKRVALKIIDPELASNREGVQRFLREAQAASAAESQHIVQVFDVGETDDARPFIVMELLRGETLGSRLERLGRLPVREAVHIMAQTLRGLSHAHATGVVHRDLKPENIFLVNTDDGALFAKIVDFGISKVMRRGETLEPTTITRQGVVLGTPHYMSPEQAQALPYLDARSDLWSIGAILFECISGQHPFPGNTYEQVIISICTKDVPDVTTLATAVPQAVADVIQQSMQRDRNRRFQSAYAFIEALRAAVPDAVPVPSSLDPSVPISIEARAAKTQLSPVEVRTRTSWSAAGADPLQSATPATESPAAVRNKRTAKLGAIALVSGAAAFAITVGLLKTSAEPVPPASSVGLVENTMARPSERSRPRQLRIVANVPSARVFVDDQPCPDGVVRGEPDTTHRVRVEADEHESVERAVVLDGAASELTIELKPSSAPVASASASASAPSKASSTHARPPAPSAPPTGQGIGGGLKLKTDIP